jgi:hypothetical protein
MTYSLGLVPATVTPFDKGPSVGADNSLEAARWFLITPAIERALQDNPAVSMLVGGERGAQYMGISPSGTHFYTKSATGSGSSSGSTKLSIPAGAQVISYAEVLSALAPVAQRASAPAGTSSKLPLYIGLGIGGLALVAGGIYLMTRKPAPAPTPAALAANRRRARRVRRNSSSDCRGDASYPCGECARCRAILSESYDEMMRERELHPLRGVHGLWRSDGSSEPRRLHPLRHSKYCECAECKKLHRNSPLAFTPEMHALHAQIEAEKAARSAPRQAPKWTPMRLNAGAKEVWWKCSRCGRSVHNHSKTRVTESRPRRCKKAKGKTSARCKFVRASSRTSKAAAFTKLSLKNARAIAASIDKSAKRFAVRHDEYPETKKDVRALKRVATLLRSGRTEQAVKRGWALDTLVRDQLPKRFYKIPSRAYPPR